MRDVQSHLAFDQPLPPAGRSRTSIEAAAFIEPAAESLRGKVLAFIRSRGEQGATREEIAIGMQLKIQTVCGRVSELLGEAKKLKLPKLIYQGSETRPTSSGCRSKVLKGIKR